MHRVVIAVHEHTMLLELAIAAEVFGVDRAELAPNGEWYALAAWAAVGTPERWLPGVPPCALADLPAADTVVVPSTDDLVGPVDPELVAALRAAHERGARIVALCTGAFVLAAAGLLDGRPATTHWMHAEELARRYPRIDVRPDVLYVDDGQVLTSAGKTAALDLCVHLVRRDFGAAAANGLVRMLVGPGYRPGGQAQFIAPPSTPRAADALAAALDWARAHLDRPITVTDLARRAGLSTRQLARRMQAETGARPLEWLHRQRVALAQELLETSDASIEQVAARCGLGTAATLRRHFRAAVGVSPTTYRATFGRASTAAG
ncbi:GlxA family transcriptional regulator [Pseudonocardia thermophila]|uniref:GlxA family transcriptional regulator n=1 Tax=Pseudonocardia thermophila TaxID=1848 RepID=UPI00248EE282|nr:helix-turn-helix domain-containing protein [Pseudonocardia thermophila]